MKKLGIAIRCALLLTLCLPTWCFAEKVTVAWDANTEPGVTGYRVSYGTASGVHTTTLDVGNQTTAAFTGLAPGQRYYFVVRAYSATQVSPASVEVSGVALGLVAVTSTAGSSTIPTGAPVTWTALASGGVTLEFQFSRISCPDWTVVQSYSSRTPSPDARRRRRAACHPPRAPTDRAFDTQRSTSPFTVSNVAAKLGAIEADVALPAPVGSPITFKAKATGGPAPLQYRFFRFNRQTNVWTLVRDYSPVDTYTWTPVAGDEGAYNIQVWVRGADSTAVYDAWRSTDAFSIAAAPPNIAIVKSETLFPTGTGAPITWKAVASGGPGPLHYRFYRFGYDQHLTMVQIAGRRTISWTPTASDEGNYVLQAWVRRAGTTVVYDNWYSTPTFQIVNAPAVIRNIASDAGPPALAGAPITWTVDATGGPGALQYQYWLYSLARDSWSMVKDYSTANTFTWMPGPWDAGSYRMQVAVRKAGSTAPDALSVTPPFDVVVDTVPTILSIVRTSGTTLRPGMPIVWTANVAGGRAPLEYAFARWSNATQSYTLVQSYSWDNSWGWMPTPGEEGSYVLQVWVRRAGSTAPQDHTTTPTSSSADLIRASPRLPARSLPPATRRQARSPFRSALRLAPARWRSSAKAARRHAQLVL
jgi:hypothetical protein